MTNFFDTSLQTVDRHGDLCNANSIDQLRVVSIEMVAKTVMVDEAY